jgi:hypothetical protein
VLSPALFADAWYLVDTVLHLAKDQLMVSIIRMRRLLIADNLFVPNAALQRHNTENSKQIFPEKKLCGLSPYFHIHVSVSDLYIPWIGLPVLLQENMWTDPGNI